MPRFSAENRKNNQAMVDLIGKFAKQKKVTPAQIALAWLLAQKAVARSDSGYDEVADWKKTSERCH